MNRNGEIELWRFIVALIIVNFHSMALQSDCCIFPYGRIGLEFFFVLSGYLLAGSALKHGHIAQGYGWCDIHRETGILIIRRIKSFFPELLVSSALACCFYYIAVHPDFVHFVQKVVSTMFGNACMLSMTGAFSDGLNGATWYLSTLLICSAILYTIILRRGVSPLYFVMGWLLFGVLYINSKTIVCGLYLAPFGTYLGNVQGFAEMLIGASLYPVVQALKKATVEKSVAVVFTLVKWILCISFVCYAHFANYLGRNAGFALCAVCGMIVLMFSEKCCDRKLYSHPLILFLGKFSLPLYLSHDFYCHYLTKLLPEDASLSMTVVVFYSLTFVTAYAVMKLGSLVRAIPVGIKWDSAKSSDTSEG